MDLAHQTAAGRRAARTPKPHLERKRVPRKPPSPSDKPSRRASISSSSSGSVLAKAAAVSDPNFALKTSKGETGVGFHGTSDVYVTDEAIAVAEHPVEPDAVLILHGVNSALEVFVATRDGRRVPSSVPTKIYTQQIVDLLGIPNIYDSDPNAWFDPKEQRWVLLFTTVAYNTTTGAPPLVVAVSANRNPLGSWVVRVLDAGVEVAPGLPFCNRAGFTAFIADYPQATYDDSFVYISVGLFCVTGDDVAPDFLSTLFAYPKHSLFAPPPSRPTTDVDIRAAVYLAPTAWYRSLPLTEQFVGEGRGYGSSSYTPANNFIQPVRPQEPEDMSAPPLFVMKVDNEFMSVATLTHVPAHKMVSKSTAPQLLARVVSKGADFANQQGQEDPDPTMLQPDTKVTLDADDTGMFYGTSGVRSYWAMQSGSLLYLTTSEFFGAGSRATRTPSVYWAALRPGLPSLCHLARKDWGMIASAEGLATAYLVIARTREGTVLAYSYSGAGTVSAGRFPAYAGVATTHVACDGGDSHKQQQPTTQPTIDIVQRGPGAIPNVTLTSNATVLFQRWGDYSAAQVLNGQMWYAVPIPIPNEDVGFWKSSWISVVDV